jgi:hypothetical protein
MKQLQSIRKNNTNNGCHLPIGDETRSSSLFLDPIEKLDESPLFTIANNILLKTSITTTKSRGDKESPVSGNENG